MRIIKKEIVFEQWNNSNLTVFNYWKQVQNDNTLSKEELESAQNLTNTIFNIRKTSTQNIDKLFIDMFNVDGVNNTMNLANQMGADIGGIEGNNVKVIFMNCEFGVNIHLINPKSEDAEKYLKIFELFNLGLENTEQYKKVLSYYHLDETFESKPKIKQHKI